MSWRDKEISKQLGIPFWNAPCGALLGKLKQRGGLLVVPSGPNLTDCRHDVVYKRALRESDVAVMDSGYLALILNFRSGFKRKCERISGLQVLEVLLNHPLGFEGSLVESDKVLWIVPDEAEGLRIQQYLQQKGFTNRVSGAEAEVSGTNPTLNTLSRESSHHTFYLAPVYKKDSDFEDAILLKMIFDTEPHWIIVCIAGGKQEKLGLFLKSVLREETEDRGQKTEDGLPGQSAPTLSSLTSRSETEEESRIPAILCTGAAIAFLTGGQASIPKWADRTYMGWLFRILHSPSKYFYRYFQAIRLPFVMGAWEK